MTSPPSSNERERDEMTGGGLVIGDFAGIGCKEKEMSGERVEALTRELWLVTPWRTRETESACGPAAEL